MNLLVVGGVVTVILQLQLLRYTTASLTSNITQRQQYKQHDDTAVSDIVLAAFGSVSETLDELWARETKLAELELERQLLGLTGSLSMPSPSLAPIQLPVLVPLSLAPINSPTINPTTMAGNCLNGRTTEQYLLDTLLEITNVDVLLNPTTPQGRAFSFLLNDTLVGENVCMYTTIEQRYGLATFYFATNGTLWNNNTNWVSSLSECLWMGILCNSNNNTINLTLPSNNIAGTLPNELSTLYLLDRIELYSNNISGTIPDGIQNLTLLEVMDIEFNQLSGPVFTSTLLSLSNLRQLFLSSNFFNGRIPSDIGSRFPFITDLWIADNELMGPLPASIGEMTSLRTFIMYGNQLDGAIPPTMGNNTELTNVQLYKNMFDEAIPAQIYSLTKLSVLRLDQNFLTGTISPNISLLEQLTDLRVGNNFIEGTIPESIQKLSNLRYFIANNNLFSGQIPDVFQGFDSLIDIDLSTAFFTGPIPNSIFDISAIQNIYLSNNALTGTIPSNFSVPVGLMDLYLDNNLLNGTVPSIEIGDFLVLNELLLQNNELTGTIPNTICTLRNYSLENLFTDCGGATPEIVCTFPSCCNRCFAGGQITNQRTRKNQQQQQQQQQQQSNVVLSSQYHDHHQRRTVMINGDQRE